MNEPLTIRTLLTDSGLLTGDVNASTMALMLRAGIVAQRVSRAAAVEHLREVIDLARSREMRFYVATARRRLGEIVGGNEGAALVATADEWMTDQGIAKPSRMIEILAPGLQEVPC